MHTGKKNQHLCPSLSIHGSKMLKSETQRYLGDILSTSEKINENINNRYNKGVGKVSEIMSILQEVSFGPHYFKMALLFRKSILLSSMLCSSEALYGITHSHIEKLEQVDRMFFRKLFQVPNGTAIEAFYLETSSIPIRYILIGRRLLYLWYILSKDENELFDSQKTSSVKNNWAIQIKQDLMDCEINLSELEISKMKRPVYKKLIKEKIHHIAAKYLISLKLQHSKSVNLKYSMDM